MLNLKKSLKLAGVLAIVLGAAAPVMTTSASASPAGHYDSYRDGRHGRFEHRDFQRHGWKHFHHEFRGRHDR